MAKTWTQAKEDARIRRQMLQRFKQHKGKVFIYSRELDSYVQAYKTSAYKRLTELIVLPEIEYTRLSETITRAYIG